MDFDHSNDLVLAAHESDIFGGLHPYFRLLIVTGFGCFD